MATELVIRSHFQNYAKNTSNQTKAMHDPQELLRQVRELDAHITRLIDSAKRLQDEINGKFKGCPDCLGEGASVVSMAGGLSRYLLPCEKCGGTGKLIK